MIRLDKSVMILQKKLGRRSIGDMTQITEQTEGTEHNTNKNKHRLHFPVADFTGKQTWCPFIQHYLN